MTDAALGEILQQRAREAISSSLGIATDCVASSTPELSQPGASFVTLTCDGHLRGCIGSLEAWRPLGDDVRENACAAAFRDPRFAPVTASEFARMDVEVSLLSPPEPMHFDSETDALRQLRPLEDGLILEFQGRRATFLPQVWEQLPTPAMFMAHLKQKAGLPADFWNRAIRLSRYHVRKWKEMDR